MQKKHVIALTLSKTGHRFYTHIPRVDKNDAMLSGVESAVEGGDELIGNFPLELGIQEELLDALMNLHYAVQDPSLKVGEALAAVESVYESNPDIGFEMLIARIFELGRRSAAIA